MLRRLITPIAAAALVLTASACGSQDTATPAAKSDEKISVKHAQGTTEVAKNPSKVVVLDYAVLDNMRALGVSENVIGVPTKTLPKFMDEFKDKDNVGTLKEPDVEKIAELEPDVILIGGRTAPKYADLNKVAPTVDLTADSKDFLGSLEKNAGVIAEIYGKQDALKTQLDEVTKAVDETKAAAKNAGTGLVLLTSGGKLSAYGPGSRFGIIHEEFGVTPAAKDLKVDNHGQAVSFEFISSTNPDRMFVIDRDAATGQGGNSAQQVLDNALVNKTKAAQDKKITYLDGSRWYLLGTGLDNTVEMANEIKKGLA
ncbi:siderophore ABC transporter substrate-binding protein [Luteococcus sp. Sow4_B9]|uniref:siderophore ABC transporter substrate-binding protein n=1 Tax=Luteococcus sp. Sow4_B9 TaxID=3438792 RepID=UPI003F9EB6D2